MESSTDNFRLKLIVYQKPGLFFKESKSFRGSRRILPFSSSEIIYMYMYLYIYTYTYIYIYTKYDVTV